MGTSAKLSSDGCAEIAIPASVVPCQLPMNEMIRCLPVARRIIRWAASLASDPANPNQTFFSKSPGRQRRSSRSASSIRRFMHAGNQNAADRRVQLFPNRRLDMLVAVAETGRRPGSAEVDVTLAVDIEESGSLTMGKHERCVADFQRIGDHCACRVPRVSVERVDVMASLSSKLYPACRQEVRSS